jgi:hypothetical protein
MGMPPGEWMLAILSFGFSEGVIAKLIMAEVGG